MSSVNLDLDDSGLFCKSIVQKRKAIDYSNPKNTKQLKLNFSQSSVSSKKQSDNKIKSSTQTNMAKTKSSKLNESTSSYFNSEKTVNTCPLCLKTFKSDSAYSAHMKECAKTHKMTTQQLLGALELQKKQMQERRALGLCTQVVVSPRKVAAKKISNSKVESYDLALGLALSKSLANCETRACSQDSQKSTLEEFGFTTSATTVSAPVPSRRRNKNQRSILKERTAEERQKIIIEKVAVVLLDEDQPEDFQKENQPSNSNQVAELWNLGEENKKNRWYVQDIKPLIFSEEENVSGAKENLGKSKEQNDSFQKEISYVNEEICNYSEIITNNSVTVHENVENVNNKSQKINQLLDKVIDKSSEEIKQTNETNNNSFGKNKEPSLPENIDEELSKLKISSISDYWSKMINNSFKSDLCTKSKDNHDVFLHTLVLFVRCPQILETDCESILQRHNFRIIEIFLNFLYCGSLQGLVRSQIDELSNLAYELQFSELNSVLNCLRNNLESSTDKSNSKSNGVKDTELLEDRDLFNDDVDVIRNSGDGDEKSGDESNEEKSYWSLMQYEKNKEVHIEVKADDSGSKNTKESAPSSTDFIKSSTNTTTSLPRSPRKFSDDSATRDLWDVAKVEDVKDQDCIVLSSGSEHSEAIKEKSPIPSPVEVDYELPQFDPFDNFHCFSEEQFSPVGLQSQSLLVGDISVESIKMNQSFIEKNDVEEENVLEPIAENDENLSDTGKDDSKRPVGYCSTPVMVRQTEKIKSTNKSTFVKSKKKKRIDLSSNRILRKSLGLDQKSRHLKSASSRKNKTKEKSFVEALATSILTQLTKNTLSPSPASVKNFVEYTPIPNKDEFGECVTPSPNYSNMGETMIKEQLTKYGLKRSLAKSKAKKILRHIYEELHPLYNSETNKIVKIIPKNTPKGKKKPKKVTNKKPAKKSKKAKEQLNTSKNSEENLSNLDKSISDSEGSEFDLSETLTQTTPSNAVDLPSAFCEFLSTNSDYHQKILLYEPIWLEELQRNLKETFKKHFKVSDLMDYLDQECITFRSETQAKNSQKRNEKRREKLLKKKSPSS